MDHLHPHLTLLTSSGRVGIGDEHVTIEMLRRYLVPSVAAAAEIRHATSFSAE